MHATLVHVKVKPEHIDEFITATRLNHQASIRETGNLRFDVLQSPEDPTCFILYEVYETPVQAESHKNTPHYLQWRSAVADWMSVPRRGDGFRMIFP